LSFLFHSQVLVPTESKTRHLYEARLLALLEEVLLHVSIDLVYLFCWHVQMCKHLFILFRLLHYW